MTSGLTDIACEIRLQQLKLTSWEIRMLICDMIETFEILDNKEDIDKGNFFQANQRNNKCMDMT